MAPQDMAAQANGKRQPAWKLRLPWEQERQAEVQKSAFIQNETAGASTSSISTIARAFLLSRRRLRLDPDKKLHFLCKFPKACVIILSSFVITMLSNLRISSPQTASHEIGASARLLINCFVDEPFTHNLYVLVVSKGMLFSREDWVTCSASMLA